MTLSEALNLEGQQGADWLRAVWEMSADAMALSDARGRVMAVNPAYCALYGYDADELVGYGFEVIFPEEERPRARELYSQVFRADSVPPSFEAQIRRKDGTERVVDSRVAF